MVVIADRWHRCSSAWRLWRIRASTTGLVTDVRTMLTTNADAERVVIETVEVEEWRRRDVPGGRGPHGAVQPNATSRPLDGEPAHLPGAMRSVATFLFLLAIAVIPTLSSPSSASSS